MISLAIILALALVNIAAGIEYPPLLVNAAALVALMSSRGARCGSRRSRDRAAETGAG